METRFRVRFHGGGETTVGSMEAFHELVRAGMVTDKDLVYDALTGQWIPAESHSVYRLCKDPLAGLDEQGPVKESDELTFELAEPRPELTREEAESAFFRQMDEERAADPDLPPAMVDLTGLGDLADPVARSDSARRSGSGGTADGGSRGDPGGASDRGHRADPVDHAHRENARAARRPADKATAPTARPTEPPAAPYVPSWGHRQSPASGARRSRRRTHRGVHVSLTLVLVLGSAGVAGGVGLAWPDLDLSFSRDVEAPVTASTARVVTATEEDIRGAAFTAFIEEVERLGDSFGVGPVPKAWLEGSYLADAAAYPAVEAYWVRFRDYVEVSRNQEEELYRSAYLAGLEDLGVSGPVRSLRLATAVADFSAKGAAREAVYARVAALADAAIELHQLSTSSQGRISYEPARGNRVSADPVIEATGRDTEMQAALDAALDRVLSALHGEGDSDGPGREGVETWLAEALKQTAM